MAPQVGLEPTTDRLTADSSTTELLRNDKITAWQRPTLTGTCVPTTIGAEKLNFRVRYGNGCDLLALITRLFIRHYFIIMSFMDFSREILIFFIPSKLDNIEEIQATRVRFLFCPAAAPNFSAVSIRPYKSKNRICSASS